MGAEPIPSLDIDKAEIQNELQLKLVEEIECVICKQFPFKPVECKSCNKLFCKYCQLQLTKEGLPDAFVKKVQVDMQTASAKDAFAALDEKLEFKMISAGRDGRGKQQMLNGPRPDFQECQCPNCGIQGDFFQPVNKVVQNCIDFCEFPHRCFQRDGTSIILWKTLKELQYHAQFECPKYGCDICYR